VVVIVEPSDYAKLLGDMDQHGGSTCAKFRRSMAQKAYARTAE
jgi:phosphoribosylaminoimidazolecarboxamide formyltransferase/IMP cyclohydrolase